MKKQLVYCILILFTRMIDAQNPIADELKTYLDGQSKYFKFNGNVLVARKGEIIYTGAHGLADYDTKRALNQKTVFELASVSKQFTAMAVLILEPFMTVFGII